MTSSNGNIFRVTGPLCGEFTGLGEFPTQRPVTRSFDVFFDLRLNKRLSKQPWGWWFEPPSWSLWRHRNRDAVTAMWRYCYGRGYIWASVCHRWALGSAVTSNILLLITNFFKLSSQLLNISHMLFFICFFQLPATQAQDTKQNFSANNMTSLYKHVLIYTNELYRHTYIIRFKAPQWSFVVIRQTQIISVDDDRCVFTNAHLTYFITLPRIPLTNLSSPLISSGCARPITGQVTSVTWPVIGLTWSVRTLSKGQKTGPGGYISRVALLKWWVC